MKDFLLKKSFNILSILNTLGGNFMENRIQLQLPDYSYEYEMWLKQKEEQEKKEKKETVIIIDLY